MKFYKNSYEWRLGVFLILMGIVLSTCLFIIPKDKGIFKIIPKKDTTIIPIAKAITHKDTVRGTCYNATAGQTDNSPFVTADGFKINKEHPFKDKVAALSRDLLVEYGCGPYSYGDTIEVKGTWIYDGLWVVHDTGPKSMKNTIDLLVDSNMYMNNWPQINICIYIK